MEKKILLRRLNHLYTVFENVQDERLNVASKELEKATDELGELIQEIEDEVENQPEQSDPARD